MTGVKQISADKNKFSNQHHTSYTQHFPTTQQFPHQPQKQQIHPLLQLQQQGLQQEHAVYQPVVIPLQPDESLDVIACYNAQRSKSLGITQLVCGLTAVALNIIAIVINANAGFESFSEHYQGQYYHGIYLWKDSNAHYIGTGIWCITFYLLCGSFAICAAKKKTKSLIITHLVFAVLGSICAVIMTCSAIWAVQQDTIRLQEGFVVHSYGNNGPDERTFYASESASKAKGALYVSILFLVTSIGQFLVCMWSTVLCSKALCGNITKIHNTAAGDSKPNNSAHLKDRPTEKYRQISLHPYPEDDVMMSLYPYPEDDVMISKIQGTDPHQTAQMLDQKLSL